MMYHDIPGTGTPLIFLHGLGCASSCDYPGVAQDASLVGRRMILVDLLGSGFSERPQHFDYSIDSHAKVVAELVADACPASVSIFGHSMGGAIAIAVTELLGSKVEKLALSEPNLDPGGGSFSRNIAAMCESDYVAHGQLKMAEAARIEGNVIWASSLSLSAAFAVHRGAASLVAGCQPTWRDMLCGLDVPKTIIFGQHSLPSADFEWLPRHGCMVDVVPEAGHSMAWDNPAGLATALNRAT
jgi:pimeloyl-ACP methyl ester carboxylesterase